MSELQRSDIPAGITAEAELAVQASDPADAEPTGVIRNDELGRYEIRHDGIVAGVLQFHQVGTTRVFTHAEVEPELRDQGVAGRLVEHALTEAREQGFDVVPQCPYVQSWLRKNPGYEDLVRRA